MIQLVCTDWQGRLFPLDGALTHDMTEPFKANMQDSNCLPDLVPPNIQEPLGQT